MSENAVQTQALCEPSYSLSYVLQYQGLDNRLASDWWLFCFAFKIEASIQPHIHVTKVPGDCACGANENDGEACICDGIRKYESASSEKASVLAVSR